MWYKVKDWDTNEVYTEVQDLKIAKKHCRAMGHTGDIHGKWYVPRCYVEDENGACVYNPRFKAK